MNGWVSAVLLWFVMPMLLWASVMSVIDQRREAKRRKQWLQEILDDLEER